MYFVFFFFQAEDGIRDLVRSRGLGDVYKRQDNRYGYFPSFSVGWKLSNEPFMKNIDHIVSNVLILSLIHI